MLTIAILIAALKDCVEHMEHSTPCGKSAYIAAQNLVSKHDPELNAIREAARPAFPVPEYQNGNGDTVFPTEGGISVRQFFAAHAIQGMLARGDVTVSITERMLGWRAAQTAYGIADAMIAVGVGT